jgi:putative Mn2+ efflux pump MntP
MKQIFKNVANRRNFNRGAYSVSVNISGMQLLATVALIGAVGVVASTVNKYVGKATSREKEGKA